MSAGMPELGSKISLISKADIRYEGRLYTVDPQECTIALSSVRSFGTEDRETQFQIAPQSQIYDYILFRGSDIKDIRVVNNSMPHPQDPAIMQVQLPNGQHLMPHFNMPNMNAPHAAPPPMSSGGYPSPFGGMGGLAGMGAGAPGGEASSSLAPGGPGPFMMGGNQQGNQQQQQQQQKPTPQQQKQPISVLDMLAGASRSTTPISLISRKSPSNELGLAGLNDQQQQLHHQQQQQNNQQQQQSNLNNAGHGGNSRDAGHKRQNHQQQHPNQQHNRGGNQQQRNGDYYHQQQQQQAQRNNHRGGRMDNYNNQHHDGRNNYNNARNQGPGNNGGGQGRGGWLMHRGGPNNNPNMMRNHRGATGRGRMPNQDYRPMGGNNFNMNKNRQRVKPLKFDIDFDFEQANNKFEELRSQLSKLKVGEDGKTEQSTTPTPSQMNGETDKKDDSGNETGAGEHEPEEEDVTIGYDKTKSFFDNISCEAAQDRTKNKKVDWRQERKLNTQTFGVSTSWHPHYNRHPSMMNSNGNFRKPGFDYYNNRNNYRNNNRMNNNPRNNNNNNRHNNGGNKRGGARDGMPRPNNSNGNSNSNTDVENDTASNLKAQQIDASKDSASTSATNQSSAKSTTQQDLPQPQVAAVGGQ